MPDTYNPDEIVKCKHLNEFARQLRIKLDGQTDPKPVIQIDGARVGNVTISAANFDGNTVNFTVPVAQIDEFRAGQGLFYAQVRFPSATVSNSNMYGYEGRAFWSADNTEVLLRRWSISRNGTGLGNVIEFGICTLLGAAPQTIVGLIHLEESDNFAARDLTYNINFVAD